MKYSVCCLLLISCLFPSCKKEGKDEQVDSALLEKKVLEDFATFVAIPNYADFEIRAELLHQAVITLDTGTNDVNMDLAQNAWRMLRQTWEQSEAFLFGPVEDYHFDTEIDDWPVNQVDLDSLLSGHATLDLQAILTLQTALKGFHPLEYLLFGAEGNKTATSLTLREKEYMKALALHLQQVSHQIHNGWDPVQTGSFYYTWTSAGSGSNRFPERLDAWVTMISAMAGICEVVGENKMQEPLVTQDSTIEESQFSNNSLQDFRNNIQSVANVYFGKYKDEGTGMNEWVNANHISLDYKIQQQLHAAINALNSITLPYGQAIFSQQIQILNAQAAIHNLKVTLEDELLPFVTATIKN